MIKKGKFKTYSFLLPYKVSSLYPRGEWSDVVPYHVPEPENRAALFMANDPWFLKPFKWNDHDIRFSPRLELTLSRITSVTPRLELPVKVFTYQEGDRIILFLGGSFSSTLTPVNPAQAVFLYYDHDNEKIVLDTKEVLDASHLVDKNPRLGRTHVFYVACFKGAFAFGPDRAIISTPAFMEKVSSPFINILPLLIGPTL